MAPSVEITFDCVPLRSIGRLDVPLDASDAHRARCERLGAVIERFGIENTYFLENAHCVFRLANSEMVGMLRFAFDGVARTDAGDAKTIEVDLDVRLEAETCGGVPDMVVAWFNTIVHDAVAVEFDRFIASGARDAAAARFVEEDGADPFAAGDL